MRHISFAITSAVPYVIILAFDNIAAATLSSSIDARDRVKTITGCASMHGSSKRMCPIITWNILAPK
eukprot:5584851-Amphidinium_carterae.1